MRKIIEHKTELTIVGAKCRWHNELGGKLEYKILSKPWRRYNRNGVISWLKIGENTNLKLRIRRFYKKPKL